MFDLPKVFKEITPESTQTDKWKELCFNTGGAPTTLQDIKVIPHSGGYAFTSVSNRFIYWRTNYDILEVIEHSLDINLCGNQIRYKFQDAPILNGITIHERGSMVIMLVPTVSSVHRLTFLHPSFERSNDLRSLSIFSDFTVENLCNPTTYHLFNTMPNLPHTATSGLTDDDDAIFCLALNNNSILLIRLQHLTGIGTCHYLKQDSGGRGFFSGITEVFLGGKSTDENNTISMALERHEENVFLFALNRTGQLRIWCCNKLQSICEYDFSLSNQLSVSSQNHILRKKWNGKNLILVLYLSLLDCSQLIVLHPRLQDNSIIIDSEPYTYIAPNHADLIEMTVECDGEVIWCIWRSLDNGEITVSALSVNSGKWSLCIKDDKIGTLDNYIRLGITPREHYLSLIFHPGMFSLADISKVLSIYKGTPQLDLPPTKSELRSKVCIAVETEIQTEALEYELSDEDYVDISERCWNKFYLNCVQYQETGKVVNNLFWLPSASLLVVISKTNLSFFRSVEVLEESLLRPDYCSESQSYKHLIKMIGRMELNEEQKLKFNQALRGFCSLTDITAEIAAEFKLENKLNLEIDTSMKYQDLQLTLRNLSDVLFMPETFEHGGDYCESFRGELGFKVVYSVICQIVKIRLEACRNLALLLQILDCSELRKDFLSETLNLCRAYFVLSWCCETVMQDHPQLISLMQSILSLPQIVMQSLLLDSVWSILQFLWSLTNSVNLAEYLLSNKQYHLLKYYSRLVNYKSWTLILVRGCIESNEPYKAADIVKKIATSPELFLKMIKLFENVDQSDIIVHIAELAINIAEKTNHPDVATLYSILFLHHLKLGHYDLAFVSLNKNSDRSRRVDCLRELVITLMNSGQIDMLLNLPYNDLLPQLEEIMEQRARSLQPQKATIYYNFLYALHIKYDNFRKAARIMFELGFRSDNNKQQMLCYSMCLNSLSLVNPDHAWVLKPKSPSKIENENEDVLEIYELKDLNREFELAAARTKLKSCPTDTSAYEVIMKLISTGRYRTALKLASLFKLKLEPPLEALAVACTRVYEDHDPWNWLVENDISDFIIGDENATVVAWRLLEALLLKYEEPKLTTLHAAVACKIMSLDISLPYWLEVSYKKRNPRELLRLYLKYGELTEASKLCCDYIAALLGKGKEIFGLEHSLGINAPSMCLPVNAIDILLHELEYHQMNDLYEEVKNSVEIYLENVQRITEDQVQFSRDIYPMSQD
ncbi:hypothetical protein PGB90_000651 [Kerria lacca]